MNDFDLILPPLVKGRVQGYLEIEVCRIRLIQLNVVKRATENWKSDKKGDCRKNRSHIKSSSSSTGTPKGWYCRPHSQEAIVKFLWWGERYESAASVLIGGIVHQQCKCSDQQQHQQQQQSIERKPPLLRYSVRTSLALFLDYLHSCEPIEIVVALTAADSGCDLTPPLAVGESLGVAHIRLPGALLRKYATNYSSGCPFEYTTEIYAIYGNGRPEGVHQPSSQLQTQQQLKTGEIQLRFRMLFAACAAKHAPALGQQQLTALQQLKNELNEPTISLMNVSSTTTTAAAAATPTTASPQKKQQPQHQQQQQHQMPTAGNPAAAAAAAAAATMLANEEAKEAMRKLDAKLVAYLAGENMLPKQTESELELELELKADEEELNLEAEAEALLQDTVDDETVKLAIREEKLPLFKRINAIKLQLEALTLEPEGTKRMELLQTDIRPIFTVECQLSHELIKHVPRYEMFHIMQFESEKFHSLTQCTRFGQEAQRAVNLALQDVERADVEGAIGNAAAAVPGATPNFGRIHFVVWWREPGTCLNEMLGMGVLELKQLYDASLLEQCKRITINRRGVQLANLYLKINLQLPPASNSSINHNNNHKCSNNTLDCHVQQQLGELLLNGNSDNNNNDNNNNDVLEESMTKQPNRNEQHAAKHCKPLTASTETATAAAGTADGTAAADAVATNAATPDNNNASGSGDGNFQLESGGNFNAETCKIRLLKGLICANEARNLAMNANYEYILVCRRFWHEEPAVLVAGVEQQFNYQEQFGVINDAQFLSRVERQQLQLEIWQRARATVAAAVDNNGNGNSTANVGSDSLQPVGVAQLPLHQFFIAYKDEAMTNRLCKGKLPVISIDAWAPIIDCGQTHSSANIGTVVGELKCMLAIGSEEQITNLKAARGLPAHMSDLIKPAVAANNLFALNRLNMVARVASEPAQNANNAAAPATSALSNTINANPSSNANVDLRKTTDLLDMLQRALSSPPAPPNQTPSATTSTSSSFAAAVATPLKPLQHKSFKFELAIMRANGLPLNPAAKGKGAKSAKRQANALTSKRFPPGEAPSTYVTFQADDCQGSKQHKSHEGGVYATSITERSIQPQWQQHFRVTTSVDYLKNPQQRFILKLWKKASVAACASTAAAGGVRLQPAPLEDAIIGFAALDLSAFARGLRIGGWFNVVDFNGRVNGQLELRAQPLEDVHKLLNIAPLPPTQPLQRATATTAAQPASVDAVIDQFENSLDLTHLNLGQAIKRKFTELEGISQRLRTRLADVTGERLAPQFNIDALDDWQPLDNECDDELAEFERDINTEVPSTSAAAQAATAATTTTTTGTTSDDNKVISMEEKTAARRSADE